MSRPGWPSLLVMKRALLLLATLAAYSVSGAALGDFDGDDRADLLLRHADGSWRLYGGGGAGLSDGPVQVTRRAEWRWASLGDFNGDGRDDLLLRRTDGVWSYYPMDGGKVIAQERGWANLTRNLEWRVVGAADFNGDGRDDILMRRSDGAWVYYPLDGRRVLAEERGWVNLPRSPHWRMAGIGDFDGDGRADVLLRHVEGEWRCYSMDGRRVVADQPKRTRLPHDLLLRFAAAGDFDGDGHDEVLLRHADGRWHARAIDGASRALSLPADWTWRLAGLGDTNGDGRDDVLLRHDGGAWLWNVMAGEGVVRARPELPQGAAWAVPARAVHFPDPALRTVVEQALGKASGESIRPRELASIRRLDSTSAGIKDLTGLEAAFGLTQLDFYHHDIRSVEPLAGLVGLRSLWLRSNAIDDISTLAHLPALENLDLGDNEITDVLPLAGLTSLRYLELDLNHGGHTGHPGIGIEDIGPLAGLTGLIHLDLSFNRVRDISPVAGLRSLDTLDLFQNRIVNIRPLAGLDGLKTLLLGRNRIEDISPLSHLTQLTFLRIGENNVTDWSPLVGLTGLIRLGLPNSHIKDLSMLSGMTKLRSLDLDNNDIEDISLLARFTAIKKLELAGNRIADIGALEDLIHLTELDLARNRISDISPLAELRALERLSFGGNEVGDISALAGLTSLVRLSAENNRIVDISSLASLTGLERLNLDRNRIVDIAPLQDLVRLDQLRLAFNRIEDVTALTNNQGLGDGDRIDLRRNPLSRASVETAVAALLERGVRVEVEVPVRPRLASVHEDSVVVLRVEEDIAKLDLFSGLPLDGYAAAIYSHFEDAFDFLMFFSNLDSFRDHEHARYVGVYSSVRNDTVGTGRGTYYDNRYGSAERLKGVIHFPYNRALLQGPALHELLHAWANYTIPTTAGAHWGFSSAHGQLGGFDLASLVELGDGRYAAGRFGTIANGGNGLPYSPIELYLAGYIPPEEVPDLWVAADGEWVVEDGSMALTEDGQRVFRAEDVRSYSIEDIIAKHGKRVPSSAEAQWHFRVAVVLLTDENHPATEEQLDLLSDHIATFSLRGDDEHHLHNFYEATGGRGSVSMGGLSQVRKLAPASAENLPASYGVVPGPSAYMVDGRCVQLRTLRSGGFAPDR